MNDRFYALICACLAMASSTGFAFSQESKPTKLVPAHPTVEAPAVVKVAPVPLPPIQRKAVAVPLSINGANPGGHLAPAVVPALPAPIHSVRSAQDARARATEIASPSAYINAVAVYDYVPGQVYQVYTSPDYVTTITLKPGEKLISKVAGDTTRWVVGDTTTGDTSNATILVVIKPVRANLRTNLMLSTNQRVYQIDLVALSGNQYQNAISWNYPQDDMRDALARANTLNAQAAQTELTGVAIENLHDNYAIDVKQGNKPEWLPKVVFDDGTKTYIDFPDNLGTTTAPPLFIVGTDGEADLVNYRVKGHFYIVDRLFGRAQLRVGKDPQTIVEITRQPVGQKSSGPFAFLRR
jgi:P-type conjugative transfer protein TrbG